MKSKTTNIVLITIMTLWLCSCSGTPDDSGEETQIEPLENLQEDPQYEEYLYMVFHSGKEIPDLLEAYELREEYDEEGIWSTMNPQQFERLALVLGFESSLELAAYFDTMYNAKLALEDKYKLSMADPTTLDEITQAVLDRMLEEEAQAIFDELQGKFAKYDEIEERWNSCAINDAEEFRNPKPETDLSKNCTNTQYMTARRRLNEEYQLEPDECVEIEAPCRLPSSAYYWIEVEIIIGNWECCIAWKCELDDMEGGIERYCTEIPMS